MKAVMFKTEASLWDMMAQRKRNWDARLRDDADKRIQVLFDPKEEVQVLFWNKETHASISCRLQSIDLSTLPGWVLMHLEIEYINNICAIDFRPEPWTSTWRKAP